MKVILRCDTCSWGGMLKVPQPKLLSWLFEGGDREEHDGVDRHGPIVRRVYTLRPKSSTSNVQWTEDRFHLCTRFATENPIVFATCAVDQCLLPHYSRYVVANAVTVVMMTLFIPYEALVEVIHQAPFCFVLLDFWAKNPLICRLEK